MGIAVGDEVDVSLVDKTLVVRPLSETERAAKVKAAMDDVFKRRGGLLKRLAEGVGPDDSPPKKTNKR